MEAAIRTGCIIARLPLIIQTPCPNTPEIQRRNFGFAAGGPQAAHWLPLCLRRRARQLALVPGGSLQDLIFEQEDNVTA